MMALTEGNAFRAASGTGCQQLMCLLEHAGVGVSTALGVGGRDLSAEVDGLATREALRRLDADANVDELSPLEVAQIRFARSRRPKWSTMALT